MWEYLVVVFWVLDVSVEYWPVPFLNSILYPVITEPPVFEGVDQDRSICVWDADFAERFVGEFGGFKFDCDGGGTDVDNGVAVASFEFGLAPSVK